MADSINEELDYKESGKEELDWGYEEGKEVSICMQRNAGKCYPLHSFLPLSLMCFYNVSAWRRGDNYTSQKTGQIETLINNET